MNEEETGEVEYRREERILNERVREIADELREVCDRWYKEFLETSYIRSSGEEKKESGFPKGEDLEIPMELGGGGGHGDQTIPHILLTPLTPLAPTQHPQQDTTLFYIQAKTNQIFTYNLLTKTSNKYPTGPAMASSFKPNFSAIMLNHKIYLTGGNSDALHYKDTYEINIYMNTSIKRSDMNVQ